MRSTAAGITSVSVDDIDEVTEPEADPDTDDFAGLEAYDLLNMIMELPPKYRMVFNLYAIEGYSHKEIGDNAWYLGRYKQIEPLKGKGDTSEEGNDTYGCHKKNGKCLKGSQILTLYSGTD
ncbi:MAG: hypothetical protein MZV63_69280 [Marinilabiliales bacterium]|nr:hypothetical protein [Marinilabiliales bacterium]